MDVLGCVIEIPEARQEWRRGVSHMRRIAQCSAATLRRAVLVGLADTDSLWKVPASANQRWQQDVRMFNLMDFLKFNPQQALLNHHSFRHFREIPALLAAAADEMAEALCGGIPNESTVYLSYLKNHGIRVCWLGEPEEQQADFLLVSADGQMFTLYREYSQPLWASLCCGCPSINHLEADVEGRYVTGLCKHHSSDEKRKAVLALEPLSCELAVEELVLRGSKSGECKRCKKKALQFRVSDFCSSMCQVCPGCASLLYAAPCFPCPVCAMPSRADRLGEVYEAINSGPAAFQSLCRQGDFPPDEFPTCRACQKEFTKHILTGFGGSHSRCRVCIDCFCSNDQCPDCSQNFTQREKTLFKQIVEARQCSCRNCYGGHQCSSPCVLCEYRLSLMNYFKIEMCHVCQRKLSENTVEEGEDEVETICSCCEECKPPEYMHRCHDALICVYCYIQAPQFRSEPRRCHNCGESTWSFFPWLNEFAECQLQCEQCQASCKLSDLFYFNRCTAHIVCVNCLSQSAQTPWQIVTCPLCPAWALPAGPVACSQCGNPSSPSVHSCEVTDCHLCWSCAGARLSQGPAATFCQLCSKPLGESLVLSSLYYRNSLCEICWHYRNLTFKCPCCEVTLCVSCLRRGEEGFECGKCHSLLNVDGMQNFEEWRQTCAFCYKPHGHTSMLSCGHWSHDDCRPEACYLPVHN